MALVTHKISLLEVIVGSLLVSIYCAAPIQVCKATGMNVSRSSNTALFVATHNSYT